MEVQFDDTTAITITITITTITIIAITINVTVTTTTLEPTSMSNYRPPALRHDRGEQKQVPNHLGMKPATAAAMAKPEIIPDYHKPRPKRWRRGKKPKAESAPAPAAANTGNGPSGDRQEGPPVLVFGGAHPSVVSCAISECDSGIALDDDVDEFVVPAGGFVVEMMDPQDPRVGLPVPVRNVAPRDPSHERLSWTVCYDDDCRIHLSDKNGSGWFPSGPGRSRRYGSRLF